MDPEIKKQFEEFDERLKLAERRVLATGNLVQKAGVPMLVEIQMRLDALIESDMRLYGHIQQVDAQLAQFAATVDARFADLAVTIKELTEGQKKTDEALRRFIERAGNGNR